MKLPNIFLPNKNLEKNIDRLLKGEKSSVQRRYTKFEVICADTYAEGIAKLKEKRQKPFTFYENVLARIADYEANGENVELFETYLDSVTGIAYKADSTKFKLILRSDKLENIKPDFKQGFMPIDYKSEQGVELDSKKGKYYQLLTREEVKNHEFWLTIMNGNKEKLAEYVNMWFDKTKVEKGMGVYLRSNISQDELRALVLGYSNDGSCAGCIYCLYYNASFVSGAQ